MPVLQTSEKESYDEMVTNGATVDGIKENDYSVIIYTPTIGSSISRVEVETAIVENGYDLPTQNFAFKLYDTDNSDLYIFRYLVLENEYHYEKYTEAS